MSQNRSVPLASRIDGRGEHILLLHPVGLDLSFWDGVVACLRDRYRILRVDLRGHGNTVHQSVVNGFDDYVGDIAAALRANAFSPAAVVGLSFGGMLAQALALRHPENVKALVVAGSASTFPDQVRPIIEERGRLAEREGMASVVDATLERWFTADFRQSGGYEQTRARLLSNNVAGWADAWRTMSKMDLAARLPRLHVPTLWLAGELDSASPPQLSSAMAQAMPAARFEVLAGAPHMMHIEKPAAFAAAVDRFLSSVSTSGSRQRNVSSG